MNPEEENDLYKFLVKPPKVKTSNKTIKVPVEEWLPEVMKNSGTEQQRQSREALSKGLRGDSYDPSNPKFASSTAVNLRRKGENRDEFLTPEEKQGKFFINDLDYLKNRRADNQGMINRWYTAAAKFPAQVLGKTINGLGTALGWLGDVAQLDHIFGTDPLTYNNWIKSAGEWIDKDGSKYLAQGLSFGLVDGEIYSSADYEKETNLWKKMSYNSFWTKDVADGVAYLASAMVGAKGVNFGTGAIGQTMNKVAPYMGIGTGQALANGAIKAGNAVTNAMKMRNIPITGAAAGWGASTAYQTISEAGTEAGEVYYTVKKDLANKINPSTGKRFTPEEIEAAAGKAASNVFTANSFALMISNGLEMKMFFPGAFAKKQSKLRQSAIKGELKPENISTVRNGFKSGMIGIASEGLWEENIQHAVSSVEKDLADGKLNEQNRYNYISAWMDNLGIFGKGLTGADLNHKEMEAAQSILIGSLIGGVSQYKSGINEANLTKAEQQAAIENWDKLSSQLDIVDKHMFEDFGTFLNSTEVTEQDAEGNEFTRRSFVDENGKSTVNLANARKLFYQSLYEKKLYDGQITALMNNDVYHNQFNTEFALGTMAYNYIQRAGDVDTGIAALEARIDQTLSKAEEQDLKLQAQQTKDALKEYANLWKEIDSSNRSADDLTNTDKFLTDFKKVLFYNAIKQNAFDKMIDQANKDKNGQLAARLQSMKEEETAFVNKITENKNTFRKIYNQHEGRVEELNDKLLDLFQAREKADDKADIDKQISATAYEIEEHKAVNTSLMSGTGNLSERVGKGFSKKDQYYFNKGKTEESFIKMVDAKSVLDDHLQEYEEMKKDENVSEEEMEAKAAEIGSRFGEAFDMFSSEREYTNYKSRDIYNILKDKYTKFKADLQAKASSTSSEMNQKQAIIAEIDQKIANVSSPAMQKYNELMPDLMSALHENVQSSRESLEEINNADLTPSQKADRVASLVKEISEKDPNILEGELEEYMEEVFGWEEGTTTLKQGIEEIKKIGKEADQGTENQSKEVQALNSQKEKAMVEKRQLGERLGKEQKALENFNAGSSTQLAVSDQAESYSIAKGEEDRRIQEDPNRLDYKLKREFADESIKSVAAQERQLGVEGDLGFSTPLTKLQKLKQRLEQTKAAYEQDSRQDLLATPEFKGFMESLNNALSTIDNLIKIAKDRDLNIKKKVESIARKKSLNSLEFIGRKFNPETGEIEIVNQELYNAYVEILGSTVAQIIDATENMLDMSTSIDLIKYLVERDATADQKKKIKDIINGQVEQSRAAIERFDSENNLKEHGFYTERKKAYFTNPVRSFKSPLFSKYRKLFEFEYFTGDNVALNPMFIYDENQDFGEFESNLRNSDLIPDNIKKEALSLLTLHLDYMAKVEARNWINSKSDILEEYKVQSEILNEESKKIKKTPPNLEQLNVVREMIKAIKAPISKANGGVKSKLSKAWTYLRGPAGAGKTRVVLNWVSRIMNYKPEDIYAFSHKASSSENISKSVGAKEVGTAEDFLETDLSGKKVVVIDEIAFFSNKELQAFEEKVYQENKRRIAEKEDLLRVIVLGDPGQIKKVRFSDLNSPRFFHNMNFVSPLTVTMRSAVPPIVAIQNAFRRNPATVSSVNAESNVPFGTKYDPANETLGVHVSNISTDVFKALEANKDSGRSKVIVVNSEADKARYKSNPTVKELLSSGKIEVLTYDEVQGETFSEVYIDLKRDGTSVTGNTFDTNNTEVEYNTALYTALSRAESYIYLQYPQSDQIISSDVAQDTESITNQIADNYNTLEDKLGREGKILTEFLGKEAVGEKLETPTQPEEGTEKAEPATEGQQIVEDTDADSLDVSSNDEVESVSEEQTTDPIEDEASDNWHPDINHEQFTDDDAPIHVLAHPETQATKPEPETMLSDLSNGGLPIVLPDGVKLVDDSTSESSPVIYANISYRGKRGTAVLAQQQYNGQFGNNWSIIGFISDIDRQSPFYRKYVAANEQKDSGIALQYDDSTGKLKGIEAYVSFENGKAVSNTKNSPIYYQGNLEVLRPMKFKFGEHDRKPGLLERTIKKFLKGFGFSKGSKPVKTEGTQVRIFKATDPDLPTHFKVKPGVPYLIIKNPHFEGQKTATKDMYIRLTPKSLTSQDAMGNGYLSPLRRMYEALERYNSSNVPQELKYGGSLLPLVLSKLAHSEGSFKIGQNDKPEFVARNYTLEDLKRDASAVFKTEANKLALINELELSKEQMDTIWEMAEKVIPEVFGYNNEVETHKLTDEQVKNFPLQAGEKLVSTDQISKKGKPDTYVIYTGDIEKAGRVIPQYKEITKLRRGLGDAQRVWNQLAKSNNQFERRLEVSIPGRKVPIIRGKGLLASETFGEFRKQMLEFAEKNIEDKEQYTKLTQMSNSTIEKALIEALGGTPEVEKMVQGLKDKLKSSSVSLTDLANVVGNTAFDKDGNSSATSGGQKYNLRMPLNLKYVNELGKDLSIAANVQELESMVDSRFEELQNTQIAVRPGGAASQQKVEPTSPTPTTPEITVADLEAVIEESTMEDADTFVENTESLTEDQKDDLEDTKLVDEEQYQEDVEAISLGDLFSTSDINAIETLSDEEVEALGEEEVRLEEFEDQDGLKYFIKGTEYYKEGLTGQVYPISEEEYRQAKNGDIRRTFNETYTNPDGDNLLSVRQATNLAKSLFPNLRTEGRSFLNWITFGLLDKPSGNEVELKFVSQAVLDKLANPGEKLRGLYLNGVAYVLKNEEGKISERILRHELFHKIYNQYLTKGERKRLRKSFRRMFPNAKVQQMDDIAFEEYLADKFGEFQRDKSFSGRITRFFTNLKRMFGFINNNKLNIENLFDAIDNGYFKYMTPVQTSTNARRTMKDLRKTFETVENFREAVKQVRNHFHSLYTNPDRAYTYEEIFIKTHEDLKRKANSLTKEKNDNEFSLKDPKISDKKRDKILERQNKIEQESKALTKLFSSENYKTVIDFLFPNSLFNKKARKMGLVLGQQQEEVAISETNLEELESVNLKDVIENAEHTDNESALSVEVKILLSNVANGDKWLNPRFAFVKMLRLMESLSFEQDFLDQFKEAALDAAGFEKTVSNFPQGYTGPVKALYDRVVEYYSRAVNPEVTLSNGAVMQASDRFVFTNFGNQLQLVLITNPKVSKEKIERLTPPELENNPNVQLITRSAIGSAKTTNEYISKLAAHLAAKDFLSTKNSVLGNVIDAELRIEIAKMQAKKLSRFSTKVMKLKNGKKAQVIVLRGLENSPKNITGKDGKQVAQVMRQLLAESYTKRHLVSAFKSEQSRNALREFSTLFRSMREKNLHISEVDYDNGAKVIKYIPAGSVGMKLSLKNHITEAIVNHFDKLADSVGGNLERAFKMFKNSKEWRKANGLLNSKSLTDKMKGVKTFMEMLGLDKIAKVSPEKITRLAEDISKFFNNHIEELGKPGQSAWSKMNEEEREALTPEEEKEAKEVPVKDMDLFISEEGSFINRLAKNLEKSIQWIRPTSVKDTNNNTVYLHHNSSQGDDIIISMSKLSPSDQTVKGGGTKTKIKVAPHLKTKFFQLNPLVKGTNTIHGIVDHDGTKNLLSGRTTGYTSESEAEWYSRNLNSSFIGFIKKSRASSIRYAQWLYTISNRPRIKGAEVNFLGAKGIKQSLRDYVKQMMARPDLENIIKSYKKYKTTNFEIINEAAAAMNLQLEQIESKHVDKLADLMYDILTRKSRQMAQKLVDMEFQFSSDANVAYNKLLKAKLVDQEAVNFKGSSPLFSNRQGTVLNKNNKQYAHTVGEVHALVDMMYKNNYVNSYFLTQLVAGDNAFFKNSLDLIKRLSGVFAPGQKGLVNDKFGMKSKFRVVTAGDAVKGKQSILDFLAKMLINDPNNKTYESLSEAQKKDVDEIAAKFGDDYELTDAQGFILPERKWDIERGFGVGYGAGRVFKGAHFENVVQEINGEEVVVPFMVKYSTVVLSDELVSRFPSLNNLRENMRRSKVDEVIFGSGNKVGKPQDVFAAEDIIKPDINFEDKTVTTLSNENFRLQSNPDHITHHTNKGVANPTQLGYFLSVYKQLVGNNKAAQNVYSTLGKVFELGFEGVKKELAKEGSASVRQIFGYLKRNMTGAGNERILELLEGGVNFNAPHIVNKAFSQMASTVTRKTVGVRFPGEKLTLQSSFGFEYKGRELEYGIDEFGQMYAEVVLPSGILTKEQEEQVRKGEPIYMTSDLMGFRIPSTGLHSAVALKVVDFYDKRGTSVVIAPKELVPLHGSDFDVDSLFVIKRTTNKDGSPAGYYKDESGRLSLDAVKAFEELDAKKAAEGSKMTDKQYRDAQTNIHLNVMLEAYLKTISRKENRPLMVSPITMEMFNGRSTKEEEAETGSKWRKDSIFYMLEQLESQKQGKKVDLQGDPDLSSMEGNYSVFKSNMEGRSLTGVFANTMKSIAYITDAGIEAKEISELTIKATKEYLQTLREAEAKYMSLKPSEGVTEKLVEVRQEIEKSEASIKAMEKTVSESTKKSSKLPFIKEGKELTLDGKSYNRVTENITLEDGSTIAVWEVMDSLINSAIDNVKEQILPIINANDLTANAISSMLMLGVNPKTVVMMSKQPSIAQMSSSGRKGIEIANKREQIVEALKYYTQDRSLKLENAQDLVRGMEVTLERLQDSFLYSDIDFTVLQNDPERAMSKVMGSEVEALLFQLAVLNEFEKAQAIGEDISNLSSMLNTLRAFPSDIQGFEKLEKQWNKVFPVDEVTGQREFREEAGFSLSMPDFLKQNPHVRKSLEIMDFFLNKIVRSGFTKHKKELSDKIDKVFRTLKFKASDVDKRVGLRDEFFQFISNSIPLMSKITSDLEATFKATGKRRRDVKVMGNQAWSQDFLKKLERVQNKARSRGDNNLFLEGLSVRRTKRGMRYLMFGAGANLKYDDILELQDHFDEMGKYYLSESGVAHYDSVKPADYTEFQKDFVRFALINFGMKFSSTNFSTILPPKLIKPFVDQLVGKVEGMIKNNTLDKVMEKFTLEVALNNQEDLPKVRQKYETVTNDLGSTSSSGFYAPEGMYFSLMFKNEGKNYPPFIQKFNNVYRRIDSGLEGPILYQRIGKKRNRPSYSLYGDEKSYSMDYSFNPKFIPAAVEDLNSTEFTVPANFSPKVGSKILMYKFGDNLRVNPVYAEVTSVGKEVMEDGFNKVEVEVRHMDKAESDTHLPMKESEITLEESGNLSTFSFKNDNKFLTKKYAGDTTNIRQAIESIAKNGSATGKLMAQFYLDNFGDQLDRLQDIKWNKAGAVTRTGKQAVGWWDPLDPMNISMNIGIKVGGKLVRFDAESLERTFLHELAHAFTAETVYLYKKDRSKLTKEQKQSMKSLKTLYREFKARVKEEGVDPKISYGITNLDEFIAESMSNPDFQAKLHSLRVKEAPRLTFLGKFVKFVKGLLGVYDDRSLYSQVLNSIIPLMDVRLETSNVDIRNVLLKESESKLDPLTQSILDQQNDYQVELDEAGNQKDSYIHLPTNTKRARVSNNHTGFLSNFVKGVQVKKGSRPYYEVKADQLWDGKPAEEILVLDGEEYDKASYLEKMEELYMKGANKGKVMHKFMELTTHNQYSTQTKEEIANEITEMVKQIGSFEGNPRIGQIEKRYNWIVKSLPGILRKHNINVFRSRLNKSGKMTYDIIPDSDPNKDQIFSEVTIGSQLLGYAGTADMFIRHPDGAYSILDWKTGRKFEKEMMHKLFKYGNQYKHIFDNPRNRANLQLMFYAFMLKVENPEMKFRDLSAVWIPNEYEANGYDPNKKVDVKNFLSIIEGYYKAEKPDLYKQILSKSPKAFSTRDYNASSGTLADTMLNQDKTPAQVIEMQQNKLRELIQSKMDVRDLTAEDYKEIRKLTKSLVEFSRQSGFPIAKWDDDISFMNRWLGSNSDVNHPLVQIYKKELDRAKDAADKEFNAKMDKFEKLMKPVYNKYLQDSGKKWVRSVSFRLADGASYKDLYNFAYRSEEINGASILKLVTKNDREWEDLTKDQQALLEFVNDSFGEFFVGKNAFLNRIAARKTDENSQIKTYSELQLYNKNKGTVDQFEYERGFLPIVPPTDQDIKEKHGINGLTGLLNKEYRQHLKRKYLTYFYEYQYEQYGEQEQALPIRYLGTRHQRANKNHTMNLAITFDRFMRSMYHKKHADNVYALGKGMQYTLYSDKNSGEKTKNLQNYLNEHISLELLNKAEDRVDFTSKNFLPIFKKGDVYQRIAIEKILKSLRNYTSSAIMWFKPVKAAQNWGVAAGLTMKDVASASIGKRLKFMGLDASELDYDARHLASAQAQVIKMATDAVKGTLNKNKTWLLMKEFRYDTAAYEFASKATELISQKRLLLGSHGYLFHTLGEEAVAASILVAQLKSMKDKEGKSMWDRYNVVEEDGIYSVKHDGHVRGYVREKGEMVKVTGLTSEEAHRMRHVYQRIQGGYRRSERTALEYYWWGKMALQFKKFLPNLLKRNFSGKAISTALGKYDVQTDGTGKVVKVKDENGKEVPVLEWQGRITEGRWRTMGGVIAEMFKAKKLARLIPGLREDFFGEDGSYKWENLSTEQKRNVLDGMMTFIGLGLVWMIFGAAFQDDDEDDGWKKMASYFIDNITQDWNPPDMAKNLARFSEFPAGARALKTLTGASEMLWSWWAWTGTAPGYSPDDAWTQDGDLKGWSDVKRGIPIASSFYETYKFIESIDDKRYDPR